MLEAVGIMIGCFVRIGFGAHQERYVYRVSVLHIVHFPPLCYIFYAGGSIAGVSCC